MKTDYHSDLSLSVDSNSLPGKSCTIKSQSPDPGDFLLKGGRIEIKYEEKILPPEGEDHKEDGPPPESGLEENAAPPESAPDPEPAPTAPADGAGVSVPDGSAPGSDEDAGSDGSEQEEEPEPSNVPLSDVAWLAEENIHEDESATTMREETWTDCIRFGSSNLNSDGNSTIVAACDQEYSKFTAEVSPQKGFDSSETVKLYIYGVTNDDVVFAEDYTVKYSTKPFEIELDISGVDELYLQKIGNYNMGKIAGQFINGYTGMGVLMRDATLYP